MPECALSPPSTEVRRLLDACIAITALASSPIASDLSPTPTHVFYVEPPPISVSYVEPTPIAVFFV